MIAFWAWTRFDTANNIVIGWSQLVGYRFLGDFISIFCLQSESPTMKIAQGPREEKSRTKRSAHLG
jgi:hypothetical protein